MEHIHECRILLVDDSEELQKMVRNILYKEGFIHIDTGV